MASKFNIKITNISQTADGFHQVAGTIKTAGEDLVKPFLASNGQDKRYPERFKVNWMGSNTRMDKVTCSGLFFSRGERMAVAAACRDLELPEPGTVKDVNIERSSVAFSKPKGFKDAPAS